MQDLRESVCWKKISRCGEEMDAFIILLCLSNKLIPKRIRHQKSGCQIPFIATQNVYWNM